MFDPNVSASIAGPAWKIAVGIAVAVPCAMLGCYLVLRRLSMLGDAISHGVLPGIVFAVLLTGQISGWGIVIGAMVFGLLTAVLTQAVHTWTNIPEDAGMGVVFTGLFALGVVMISQLFRHSDLDTDCVLYGVFEAIPLHTFDFLGYEIPRSFPTMVAMLLITLAFIIVLWKELKIVSFDPQLATAIGLKAGFVHYLLMAMVAGVTVTAFEAVGSVLVVAMLIVPAATAHLLTDRLPWMMVWASVTASTSVVFAVILAGAQFLDTNTAGLMAVFAGLLFVMAVLFAPRHGVAARLIRNFKLGIRIVAEDLLAALYRKEEADEHEDATTRARLQEVAASAAQSVKGKLAVLALRRENQLAFSAEGDMQLTELGRQRAESLVRSHRLWESYLDQHFDLPPDHLHDPAMRMEHFIGPQLREKLAAELAQPETDPHGKAIPPSPD